MGLSKYFYVFLLIIFLHGCSTTLTEQGRRIQIVTKEEVKACKFLVNLEGTSTQSGLMKWNGIKNAKNDLINQAGEREATHLVLGEGKPHYWTMRQTFHGQAYRCNQPN